MLKRKRRWPFFVVGVIAMVAGYGVYKSRAIPRPESEGDFQDLSGWLGPIRDSGWHLKFPEFDLSQPFSAEYHLKGLTNVGDRCGLYLILIDKSHKYAWGTSYSHVGGRLAFRLSTSAGKDVVNVDHPLRKYIWWGFKNKHGLYDGDGGSHFYPNYAETYNLKVIYEPAAELSGMRGYVYLNTGAKYSGSPYR